MIVERPFSFYNVWLNEITPIFIILSRYASIFSSNLILPVDIIRYILCIYLRFSHGTYGYIISFLGNPI